jgi:hypothetical protein
MIGENVLTLAGIVLPSLLVTWMIRRWIARVDWRIAGLCLLLALGFVSRGVFSVNVPLPLDEVVRGWPYRGLTGEPQVKNYLTNDTVKQILPWMAAVREELAHGRAPLWDRYLFCGYPLLGNGQSAPFSPFFLATLFVPLPKQLVAMAGLKLFTALLFGYLFLRREGVGDAAALFGSIVFAFAIFNNCFLYYPMTAVTLLLPAAAYAVLACIDRAAAANFVLVALVVAALLAGGHPESVVHVALAVIALLIIDYCTRRRFRWRDFARASAAALLGLLVAAPSWVPVLEMATMSNRVAWLKTIALGAPIPPTALWAMIAPDGFGNPAHHDWNWIGEYPQIASLYLGLIVTALFPAALFSRRAGTRDRLLAAVTLVFFVVSMHWTLLTRLFYAAPPLSWVGHDRLRFVVAFFAGIIAARTVSRLRRDDVVIAAVTAVGLLALFTKAWLKMNGRTLHGPLALTGALALAAFFVVARRFPRRAPLTACVLTLLELVVFTYDYNALNPRRWYAPRLPIVDALRRIAPAEPFRVVGRDWVFLPNAAAQYGLEDVRGSDPMEWGEYRKLFPPRDPFQESVGLRRFPDVDEPILDALNVRFLLAEPDLHLGGKWRSRYAGADGELYENAAWLPRFFVPRRVVASGDVHGVADFRETAVAEGVDFANPEGVRLSTWSSQPTRFRLRVEAPSRALVASSQPAMRWWRVLVTGKPVETVRIDGAFLGFFVPPGSSEVVVEYRPLSWWAAVAGGVLGGLLLVFLAQREDRGIGPIPMPLCGVPTRDLSL